MKRFFYAKIALTNLKKNRQTYFPYLLTCIATIMMFYIMSSLSTNSVLNKMRGGATMGIVLMFGTVVVGIFAVLFLFYTNSFLVKRRKKEFGLYYILGMEKRHISRVMLWETLYTAMLSLAWNCMRNPVFQAGFSGTSENPEDERCDRRGNLRFYAGRNRRTFCRDLSSDLL